MKLKPYYCLLILGLVLAGIGLARGQSHRHDRSGSYDRSSSYGQTPVPGPEDYAAFSRFIAERNIFNPDRYPRISGRPTNYQPPINHSAPAFSFVGTMVYGKGMFAFFDGNNDDYRKSLQVSGTIAGYTVQQITLTNVVLAEGSNTLSLAVGSVMRRARDGTWVQSDQSEDFSAQTGSSANTSGNSPAAVTSDTPAPPSAPSGPMSDVLKRLMMQRQQENK